jgi:hypothetical protein
MPVRNSRLLQRVRSWPRRIGIIITVIAMLLLGARIEMPYVVKRMVNDRLQRIWEHIVAGAAWLVKDKARDQVATRIPFEGRFGDAQLGLFATVTNLFRHGFIRAFNPTVEGSVHADNVLPTGKSADGNEVAKNKADENPGEESPMNPKDLP